MGPDEHERQLARGAGHRRDALARVGVLEAADPDEVVLGQPVALAHRAHLLGGARVHRRGRRLGDHGDALGRDPQLRGGVAGDHVRGDDQARCALDGVVAQAKARAGAQVLRPALERHEVVQRDHLRAARVQRRAVDPGRVVEVGVAGPVALDELVSVRGGAQAVEQAPHVAPDAARVARPAAVERHLHGRMSASTRSA